MSGILERIFAKLEYKDLEADMRSLLGEAAGLITRQDTACIQLQADITRLQKRYSELERDVTFRGFSGVAVWHGDFRLQLVSDGFPDEKDLQPVLRLLDRAKAEFQILTENQNAQNHPKQD
jgi:hypothetical protein